MERDIKTAMCWVAVMHCLNWRVFLSVNHRLFDVLTLEVRPVSGPGVWDTNHLADSTVQVVMSLHMKRDKHTVHLKWYFIMLDIIIIATIWSWVRKLHVIFIQFYISLLNKDKQCDVNTAMCLAAMIPC